jgi:hypothetical protein
MFWEADEDDPFSAKKKGKKDAEVTRLYGDWQTEEWIPPKAENGKVPKNERGNVLCPPLAYALPRVGRSHMALSVLAGMSINAASARGPVAQNNEPFCKTNHPCHCAAGDYAPEGSPQADRHLLHARFGLCGDRVAMTGPSERRHSVCGCSAGDSAPEQDATSHADLQGAGPGLCSRHGGL